MKTALITGGASGIVLSRFLSINTWSFKIGFSFVPIVLAAMLYAGIRSGSGWIPDGAV